MKSLFNYIKFGLKYERKYTIFILLLWLSLGVVFIQTIVFVDAFINQSKVVLYKKTIDYGIVKDIKECEYKKRIICAVETDKYHLGKIDFSDYPGDGIIVNGDHLFAELWFYEDRIEFRNGRNGYTYYGFRCFKTNDCYDRWKKYEKNE